MKNNENPRVLVTIYRQYDAEAFVPELEAAGLEDCRSYEYLNVVLGRIAVASETDATVARVKAIPGVKAVDQEPDHFTTDEDQ